MEYVGYIWLEGHRLLADDGHDVLARLPESFWQVRYVGSRFPGSAAVKLRPGLEAGANCQLYAYEVARYFGLEPPDLRSSELWQDSEATERVEDPQSLDLILFNATADPWGAHVGLWVGDDRVLHLCAEVGYPVVWSLKDFAVRERYQIRVGIKRIRRGHVTGGRPQHLQPRRERALGIIGVDGAEQADQRLLHSILRSDRIAAGK